MNRVRFCDSCERHVYNLVEMSNSEIRALLLETEGRVCGRIFRRFDGTIMTRDCPVGLRALRKRVAGMASAVFARFSAVFQYRLRRVRSNSQAASKSQMQKLSETNLIRIS
jgi:hypothetical protein